jgi:hypothetical protein
MAVRAHRGGIISAATALQIRRENLRIPAAGGPDLDHGVRPAHAEEIEGLLRIAIAVARDIGRRA